MDNFEARLEKINAEAPAHGLVWLLGALIGLLLSCLLQRDSDNDRGRQFGG